MTELLMPAEMIRADRAAIEAGTPGIVLMDRAGTGVADAVSARFPRSRPVCILAGTGNNGGDGFVAARVLRERGYCCTVLVSGDPQRIGGDAGLALAQWSGEVAPAAAGKLPRGGAVIIDALLGAGLDRPVTGPLQDLIEAINGSGCPVVAVDLPSGIDGATGAVRGVAIEADLTVTFFRRKPAHVLLPGRLHCGETRVIDIGIAADVLPGLEVSTFHNTPALWGDAFPVPGAAGHKYGRGHAVVVSGGMASTGAARLAALGALRGGAGLVTVASPPDALAVHAAANLAVMVREVKGAAGLSALLADPRLNAVLLGPGGGMGPAMREQVLAALEGPRAVVLDADALTSFADAPEALFAALRGRSAPAVLTPHDGEFFRLFPALRPAAGDADKLGEVRRAAALSGAVIVRKGADTVVAAPEGRAAIADNAPPWLATAGSGDVLAGLIAGLLAQGMAAFPAAAAAVWVHGEAGAACGPGLISEDLPGMVPGVYRRLLPRLRRGRRRSGG